jgi:hypothetical protein
MIEFGKAYTTQIEAREAALPQWVPKEAKHYLSHTETGQSIRELARKGGCSPSTILRQVRKIENKRDDPLIDEALSSLRHCRLAKGQPYAEQDAKKQSIKCSTVKETSGMSKQFSQNDFAEKMPLSDEAIEREARRVLRRLNESGACLAVAKEMDKAVVVRDLPDGGTARTAIVDRPVAQALALKDWISAREKGKIIRYTITAAGRSALRGFVAAEESARAGFSEAQAHFEGPAQAWDAVDGKAALAGPRSEKSQRIRYNAVESPVMTLSRRKDKNGEIFLPPELVAAAERLREDFELAQMGEKTPQDWEAFVAGTVPDAADKSMPEYGAEAAKLRVASALADLGPGLGDVALRCCCYLEGMEQAESRMGWSARSGKIVLRIALQRLQVHYDGAGYSNLIG